MEGERWCRSRNFFDLGDGYVELSKASDPLERLNEVVSFEAFRYRPHEILKR